MNAVETRHQPEVPDVDEALGRAHGGDRRIARREPRGSRVTVRLSAEESSPALRDATASARRERSAPPSIISTAHHRRRRSTLTCCV